VLRGALSRPVTTEAARTAGFSNELGVDGTVRFLRNVMGLRLLQECVRAWRRQGDPIDLPRLLAEAGDVPGGGAIVDPDRPEFLPPGDMPERLRASRAVDFAISVSSAGSVAAIRHLISWPEAPTPDWQKGFLAGIFDAEGSYSQGVFRIANTDPEIISRTAAALASLGFAYAAERTERPNGLVYLRLRGGLREVVRFFHTVDTAITRKRSIDGVALKSDAELNVTEIKPLGIAWVTGCRSVSPRPWPASGWPWPASGWPWPA
jgi:LAGLIDADG-like domain